MQYHSVFAHILLAEYMRFHSAQVMPRISRRSWRKSVSLFYSKSIVCTHQQRANPDGIIDHWRKVGISLQIGDINKNVPTSRHYSSGNPRAGVCPNYPTQLRGQFWWFFPRGTHGVDAPQGWETSRSHPII